MGGIDTNYDHVLVYSSSRLTLNPIQQYVTHNLKLPAGHISQIGLSDRHPHWALGGRHRLCGSPPMNDFSLRK